MYAYNLPDFSEAQIEKGPDWTDDTYDIEGKFSDPDYAVIQKMSAAERQEQIQLRLQSVLKERFHLAAHLEKREQTIYALEVARSGPKLSAAKHQVPDRFGIMHRGMDYELKATGTDLDRIASLLGREPEVGGRSIVNRTGLSGNTISRCIGRGWHHLLPMQNQSQREEMLPPISRQSRNNSAYVWFQRRGW